MSTGPRQAGGHPEKASPFAFAPFVRPKFHLGPSCFDSLPRPARTLRSASGFSLLAMGAERGEQTGPRTSSCVISEFCGGSITTLCDWFCSEQQADWFQTASWVGSKLVMLSWEFPDIKSVPQPAIELVNLFIANPRFDPQHDCVFGACP